MPNTNTALAFTGPKDLQTCGPYTIRTDRTPSGAPLARVIFYGCNQIGKVLRLGQAIDVAQAHWVSNGCPSLDVEGEHYDVSEPVAPPPPAETDEETLARIHERFRVMNKLVTRTIEGKLRSLIISGPGGVGKTHPTEAALRSAGVQYVTVSGSISAIGLYKAAWEMRYGGVILIDDADGVFDTVDALNLLKCMLDSKHRRVVSWLKQAPWMEEEGIEPQFEFAGQVIFISNIDFEGEVEKGHKRAPHLEALLSRSLYLDLEISTARELVIRIEDMVCNQGMLNQQLAAGGVEDPEQASREIVDFMKEHASKFRSLTLREAVKLANLVIADPEDWRAMALATLSRRRR